MSSKGPSGLSLVIGLALVDSLKLIRPPDTEVTNDLNDAYSRMHGLGQAYAVVGNHDSSPVNSFPPPTVDTTITTQWAYDAMSSGWESWIGATAAAQVESNYGSYSVKTSEGLRIISVNTNFWYKV